MITLYDELGLTPRATNEEIHSAYRKLAQQFHPDRNPGFHAEASERFKRIQHAFDVLSDSAKRAKYDETLGPHAFASGPPSTVVSPPEIRVHNRSRRRKKRRHFSIAFFSVAIVASIAFFGLMLLRLQRASNSLQANLFDDQAKINAPKELLPAKSSQRPSASQTEVRPRVQSLENPPIETVSPKTPAEAGEPSSGGSGSDPANDLLGVLKRFADEATSGNRRTNRESQSDSASRLQARHEPNVSQLQSITKTRELLTALKLHDKNRVSAALKSLKATDPQLTKARAIVDELMPENGNEWEYADALKVLDAFHEEAGFVLDYLLQIQDRFNSIEIDNRNADIDPIRLWYNFLYVHDYQWDEVRIEAAAEQLANAEVRRELTRLLAEFYAKDQRIARLFNERVEQLKSEPQPADRALAALWLSRSTAVSQASIPALLDAVKNDVSLDVKRAALVALAGFQEPPTAVTAVVDKGLDYFIDDAEMQLILLGSLSSVDSNSQQFKRVVIARLSDYKKSRKWDRVYPVWRVLQLTKDHPTWAVPPLLNAAEVAIYQGANNTIFQGLTAAVVNVGSADERVRKFYELAANQGPEEWRVYCDTVAKKLK